MNESFELHNTLNKKIWDSNNELYPDVKEALKRIVSEYIESSEIISESDVIDAELVGSNASFNYTKDSDLDLHLVVNMEDLSCDPEIVQIACNAEKASFNRNYDLSIKGIEIELYVEDVKASTASNGIYSLFKEEWIKFPEPIESKNYSTDAEFISKLDELRTEVETVLTSANNAIEIQEEINNLYNLRRESIMIEGEYGFGNQLFKEIRSLGLLDELKEKKYELASKELSLESLLKESKKLNSIKIYRGIDKGLEKFDSGVSWWTTSLNDAKQYGSDSSDNPDNATVLNSTLDLSKYKGIVISADSINEIYRKIYYKYILKSEGNNEGNIILRPKKSNKKSIEKQIDFNNLAEIQPYINSILREQGYKYILANFKIGSRDVNEIAILDDSILDYKSPSWYIRENNMKRYRINYLLKEDYHYSFVEADDPNDAAKTVYDYFDNSDDYELLSIEEPEDEIDKSDDNLQGPPEGSDSGLASVIISAINDEWQTISTYNDLANIARGEGREDIAKVIDDINAEENNHVGMLQEVMKDLSSVTSEISSGEEEAANML